MDVYVHGVLHWHHLLKACCQQKLLDDELSTWQKSYNANEISENDREVQKRNL